MDQTDAQVNRKITQILSRETQKRGIEFHALRHRSCGYRLFVDFHLLFSSSIQLEQAHDIACEVESILRNSLGLETEIITHLEPKINHDEIHNRWGIS